MLDFQHNFDVRLFGFPYFLFCHESGFWILYGVVHGGRSDRGSHSSSDLIKKLPLASAGSNSGQNKNEGEDHV